jgi:gliding motility-associated-like protein
MKFSGIFRNLKAWLIICLAAFCFSESKAQTFYANNFAGDIYLVNPSTCTSTLVVSTGIFWSDIAICGCNPNIMYGVSVNDIYTIDLTTGAVTLLNNQFNIVFGPNHGITGLSCDGCGHLYLSDVIPGIYEFDIAASTWSFLGAPAGASGGDIVFYNGAMYQAGWIGTQFNTLEEITFGPLSSQLNGVMNVPPLSSVFGLAVTGQPSLCTGGPPQMMYALADSSVFMVNPANAFTTLLCSGIVPGGIAGAASIDETISASDSIFLNQSSAFLCMGESDTLIVSGAGNNGTYSWQPGNLSGSSIIISPVVSTTYTVIGTNAAGCSDTIQIPVVVNPLISASSNSQMANCNGACTGSSTVLASGGSGTLTYAWSPSGATTSSVSALCASTYTCVITDSAGCSISEIILISQPPPIIAAQTVVNPACFGECTGSIALNVTGGNSTNYNYSWTPPLGNTATVTSLCAGSYSCMITDNLGCPAITSMIVTQPSALVVSTANALSLCAGDSDTLTVNVSGGIAAYSYSWQPGNMNSANPVVTPPSSTTFTVLITDANNCVDSATQHVVVNALPTPEFTISDSIGCAPLCITFTTSSPSVTGIWTFENSLSDTGNAVEHCYTSAGTYDLGFTATDANGCSASLFNPGLITIYPVPSAAFSYSPEHITFYDPTVVFTDESSPVVQWNWNFDESGNTSSSQNPEYLYQDTGCFNVRLIVTDTNGCSDDTIRRLCIEPDYAVYVPNAFTPNANGLNDVFLPVISGYERASYHLRIFDRWGNLIFESDNVQTGWDGKVQDGNSNRTCQIDTYVWVINVNEWNGVEHQYRGHVNIIK